MSAEASAVRTRIGMAFCPGVRNWLLLAVKPSSAARRALPASRAETPRSAARVQSTRARSWVWHVVVAVVDAHGAGHRPNRRLDLLRGRVDDGRVGALDLDLDRRTAEAAEAEGVRHAEADLGARIPGLEVVAQVFGERLGARGAAPWEEPAAR